MESIHKQKREEKIYLELLRIIAIYFVIFNHTNQRGYIYFTTLSNDKPILYYLTMCFSVFCTMSVPMFFMISGITLLDKNEDIATLWKKRILRMVGALIVFSLLHYFVQTGFNPGNMNIRAFAITLYSGSVIAPFWFLYYYIGFLIILPFLRSLAKNLEEREYRYLIALFIIVRCVIQPLQYILSKGRFALNGQLNYTLFTDTIVFYPLLGYYLEKHKTEKKQMAYLWAFSIIALMLSCFLTQYKLGLTGEIEEAVVSTFFTNYRIVFVVTLYYSCRCLTEHGEMPVNVRRLVMHFGSCVFGTYLIEQIVREYGYGFYDDMCSFIHPFISVLLYVFGVMLISFLIVTVLKKIPMVNRII